MIPFKRSCKEVAALVIAREDRALPLADRLAVRLHMGICSACPMFERQIQLMRHAMRHWRNVGADAADAQDSGSRQGG
jgi:Putative zinc-finger